MASSLMSVSLVLLTVLSFCCSFSYEQNQTFVDGRIKNNSPSCILGGQDQPCHTIEYAVNELVSRSMPFIGIVIVGPEIMLNSLVKFDNVSNITFSGAGGESGIQVVCKPDREAGFVFSSVHNLRVQNISIRGCGIRTEKQFKAVVYIKNSIDVTFMHVKFLNSAGIALAFSDTYGEIRVYQTHFNVSEFKKSWYFGGAVYITFTRCQQPCGELSINSTYSFEKCTFMNNTRIGKIKGDIIHNGMAGGLGLFFSGNSCCNNVTVKECKFSGNYAVWGGGMYIGFMNQSLGNLVTVINSEFIENYASDAGGGVSVVYHNSNNLNHVQFYNIKVIANRARYGGGTAISANYSTDCSKPNEMIKFDHCLWNKNSARYGSAVDISPLEADTLSNGFYPVPLFTECTFTSNWINRTVTQVQNGTKYIHLGSFTVTKFNVQFGNQVIFRDHSDTPLYVTSGTISFQPNTTAWFDRNYGINGGAIALYGFSYLQVRDDSLFNFTHNTASEVGGAIYYHPLEQQYFISKRARSCFIHYAGESSRQERNVIFEFRGNQGIYGGNSIYAITFSPCVNHTGDHSVNDSLQEIADFVFEPYEDALATAGVYFNVNGSVNGTVMLSAVPGKLLQVPISIEDLLRNKVYSVYRVTTSNKTLKVNKMYSVHGTVRLYGEPNAKGELTFTTVLFRLVSYTFHVTLLHCPPGFYLDKSSIDDIDEPVHTCDCAVYYVDHAYPGIDRCNQSLFQAYISHRYWAGYLENETPDGLYTAPCPLGFCTYENKSIESLYLLPETASNISLTELMCGKYRKGILCGECRNNYSVHYHSQHYKCGEIKNCRLSLLFYFLSEIIPVTVLFTVIVVFDIRFTSGTVNGFIFFCQVLDTLSVDAKGVIQFPSPVDKLSIGYGVIYGLFNFDFFSIDPLSFCLWKQGTVLDILAFKYVTVIFAFGLVISLVVILHNCRCKRLCTLKKKLHVRDSVIHGLSAFLVICYAQCTKISFHILAPVTLTGEGGCSGIRVSVFGGIPYFTGKHLAYAIPACICLLTIVTIPPVLLLAFPLVLQLLALCGVGESRAANWVSRYVWTFRLKPVLDSFQACFKDNSRYFAGLYFLYRVVILSAYAFGKNSTHFYITIEVLLIFMLGLHAVVQPYEKKQHNVVDALIFINLAIINGFTTFNYLNPEEKSMLNVIAWFQMILIYLPIVCLSCFIVVKISNRWKASTIMPREEHFLLDSLINHERLPYQEFEQSEQVAQESL